MEIAIMKILTMRFNQITFKLKIIIMENGNHGKEKKAKDKKRLTS